MEFVEKLPESKKLYFASDFHLGAPTPEASFAREKKLIRWLEKVKEDAYAIFLLGDLYDFWFEYKHAIPKGFTRFNGKLAEINDSGIKVFIFTGNHDMWMFNYFQKELGIPVFFEPRRLEVNGTRFLIGHGDGLGPGDKKYKILKRIFASKLSQWMFARIHPNLGIGLAKRWSKNSRLTNEEYEEKSYGEKEFLFQYCRDIESVMHHDYYIFGHRHISMELEVGNNSRYVNLGEWVNNSTYATFESDKVILCSFED